MDAFDIARNVAAFVGSVLSTGAIAYTWLTSRSKVNSEEIRELRETSADHELKIQALETALSQMPTKDTVHALDRKVTELNGTISVVAESLRAVERTAHRIENFLLDQAKK